MKRTYNLDSTLVDSVRDAVTQGLAPSQDALVEQALRRELRLLRDVNHAERWANAAGDLAFQSEVEDIHTAYRVADAETWPRT